ncbi:MAG: DUF2784 domain-containing protein [Bacteroidota bacterium]
MSNLQLLDFLFTAIHLVIIGFNLLGWIWRKTRRAHFVVICITAGCWLILGIWYGIGYCPVTDWQWQIKEQLGEQNLPGSFIKYFADKVSGMDIDSNLIDWLTAVCFAVSVGLSVYFNFFSSRKRSKS